mmetsp:Transcript_14686/g.32368  ORF Transcript_14686/g.32368 Transcript_14686/m.32368 type:complete len:473 (+) Transcript_14686:4211-5629(+)
MLQQRGAVPQRKAAQQPHHRPQVHAPVCGEGDELPQQSMHRQVHGHWQVGHASARPDEEVAARRQTHQHRVGRQLQHAVSVWQVAHPGSDGAQSLASALLHRAITHAPQLSAVVGVHDGSGVGGGSTGADGGAGAGVVPLCCHGGALLGESQIQQAARHEAGGYRLEFQNQVGCVLPGVVLSLCVHVCLARVCVQALQHGAQIDPDVHHAWVHVSAQQARAEAVVSREVLQVAAQVRQLVRAYRVLGQELRAVGVAQACKGSGVAHGGWAAYVYEHGLQRGRQQRGDHHGTVLRQDAQACPWHCPLGAHHGHNGVGGVDLHGGVEDGVLHGAHAAAVEHVQGGVEHSQLLREACLEHQVVLELDDHVVDALLHLHAQEGRAQQHHGQAAVEAAVERPVQALLEVRLEGAVRLRLKHRIHVPALLLQCVGLRALASPVHRPHERQVRQARGMQLRQCAGESVRLLHEAAGRVG